MISSHLEQIGRNLDKYLLTYENFLLLGDFNADPKIQSVLNFCHAYSCRNLINENTCFKNPLDPSCIDLMIIKMPKSFEGSLAIETGLSDFHKLVVSFLKKCYKKTPPLELHYRDYKIF